MPGKFRVPEGGIILHDFRQLRLNTTKEFFLKEFLLCKGIDSLTWITSHWKAQRSEHMSRNTRLTSYGRILGEEERLTKQIEQLIAQVQRVDCEEMKSPQKKVMTTK